MHSGRPKVISVEEPSYSAANTDPRTRTNNTNTMMPYNGTDQPPLLWQNTHAKRASAILFEERLRLEQLKSNIELQVRAHRNSRKHRLPDHHVRMMSAAPTRTSIRVRTDHIPINAYHSPAQVSHSQPSLVSHAATTIARRSSVPDKQHHALTTISEEHLNGPTVTKSSGGAGRRNLFTASSEPRRRRAFVPLYAGIMQTASPSPPTAHLATPSTTNNNHYNTIEHVGNPYVLGENNNFIQTMKTNQQSEKPSLTQQVGDLVPTAINANAFDEQDLVFDEAGQLLGGSLRALLKRFIPRRDYTADRNYIFTFLLNARVFLSPSEILQQVLQSCMFEQNCDADNFKKERRTRFYLNIAKVAKEWAESFPYDFVDAEMHKRLQQLLSLCAAEQQSHGNTQSVMHNLNAKLLKLERYEKALHDIGKEEASQTWPSETFSGIALLCESAAVTAHQLTHIELERLSMIGAEEFVEYFLAMKITDQKNLVLNTKNIAHYMDWSNRLTALVCTEITKHLKKRHRVRMLEYFIEVAKECFNIGNFNSLMSIAAAIDSSTVTRLKKTWHKVPSINQWDAMRHQCDPSGNFSSYRATLKAAMWRAEGASAAGRVVVPFFSLQLKDLTVLHQKCRRKLPNGHLNFAVFGQFADSVRQLQKWKNVLCPFERNPSVLQYLLTTNTFSSKALQLASFECEQPDSHSDKDLHKKLKFELNWTK